MPLRACWRCRCRPLAQEQTGSIVGIVKDTSGAVLPGVTVEAKSLSTGAGGVDAS